MKLELSAAGSHKHFCAVTGHGWECNGTALRRRDTEPSVCLCRGCGLPLADGDHSRCENKIEIVVCPKHRDEELRRFEAARLEYERAAAEFGLDEKWKTMKALPDGPEKDAAAQGIVEWLFR